MVARHLHPASCGARARARALRPLGRRGGSRAPPDKRERRCAPRGPVVCERCRLLLRLPHVPVCEGTAAVRQTSHAMCGAPRETTKQDKAHVPCRCCTPRFAGVCGATCVARERSRLLYHGRPAEESGSLGARRGLADEARIRPAQRRRGLHGEPERGMDIEEKCSRNMDKEILPTCGPRANCMNPLTTKRVVPINASMLAARH